MLVIQLTGYPVYQL